MFLPLLILISTAAFFRGNFLLMKSNIQSINVTLMLMYDLSCLAKIPASIVGFVVVLALHVLIPYNVDHG